LRQIENLAIEFPDVSSRQFGYLAAWSAPQAPLLQDVSKFCERKADPNGASYHLDSRQRCVRIEAVSCLAASGCGEKPELFVMMQRVRTDAGGASEFSRLQKTSFLIVLHREFSMNPRTGSGVKAICGLEMRVREWIATMYVLSLTLGECVAVSRKPSATDVFHAVFISC
jgi:hypothetical protein